MLSEHVCLVLNNFMITKIEVNCTVVVGRFGFKGPLGPIIMKLCLYGTNHRAF